MKFRFMLVLVAALFAASCEQPSSTSAPQSTQSVAASDGSTGAQARVGGGSGAGNGFTCVGEPGRMTCSCVPGSSVNEASCSGLRDLCKKQRQKYECEDRGGFEVCGCSYNFREGAEDDDIRAPDPAPLATSPGT